MCPDVTHTRCLNWYLDVTMRDPIFVKELQAPHHLCRVERRYILRERAEPIEDLANAAAGHVLQEDGQRVALEAAPVVPHDIVVPVGKKKKKIRNRRCTFIRTGARPTSKRHP